jgi:hypothetical protein
VVAIVTGVLLGVVLLAGSAQAFHLFRADWSYKSRPMGEPWQVCTAGMPAGFAATIRRAASTWNYRGFRFTFKSNGCSSGGGRPRFNGVNQIGLGSGLGRGVLASTTRFYNRGSGQMLECDLRFNDAQRWYVGRGNVPNGQIDLYSVALHEFGHCLGLEHSGGRSTVMSPTIGDGVARRRLGSDDIAGRAAIYGR